MIKQDAPNLEVVDLLEKLLDEAHDGKIMAFAYCTCKSADVGTHGWVQGAYGFDLVDAVRALQYRYLNHMAGDGG